jgi:hypothetical protein
MYPSIRLAPFPPSTPARYCIVTRAAAREPAIVRAPTPVGTARSSG